MKRKIGELVTKNDEIQWPIVGGFKGHLFNSLEKCQIPCQIRVLQKKTCTHAQPNLKETISSLECCFEAIPRLLPIMIQTKKVKSLLLSSPVETNY